VEAKRDPAWGFSRNSCHALMEKRIRREIEESISRQRRILADLKRTIADWSRPWHPPVKKPRKQTKSPMKPKAKDPDTNSINRVRSKRNSSHSVDDARTEDLF
jgi:hypothetical protein